MKRFFRFDGPRLLRFRMLLFVRIALIELECLAEQTHQILVKRQILGEGFQQVFGVTSLHGNGVLPPFVDFGEFALLKRGGDAFSKLGGVVPRFQAIPLCHEQLTPKIVGQPGAIDVNQQMILKQWHL